MSEGNAAARVGIDVGGTFTDGILVRDGEVTAAKVPSRPSDVASAILDCCEKLGVDMADVALLIHGTTIATNAIIQKRGPSLAHVTTRGYRDVLHIRRGDSEPYNLAWQPPTPVVRRRDIYEVDERVGWDGQLITEFDEDEAKRVAQIIGEKGYEAVSVTFLHAYADPAHELRMKEILEQHCPDASICISSEVLPHYREFERSSTTAVNAYLMPLMSRYLTDLSARLDADGLEGDALIMQSNGGLMTIDETQRMPARTARSGPAGGAIAAVEIADRLDLDNAILIDMGGTSTEVAVRHERRLRWTPELEFAWGVPIRFPSVEILSIGAGGGSIAWIEGERFLKVGPQSAGADPGPACYARGGTSPTTTDAQVVLGRLDPSSLLGGAMEIESELAERTISEQIAEPLGMSLVEAAKGILRVTTNNTMQAIRLMTVNRGLDPRDSTLIAYGGSGPLYAAEIAGALGIGRVVIPAYSGITSAIGMVQADYQYDHSSTLLQHERDLDLEGLAREFGQLEDHVNGRLDEAEVAPSQRTITRHLDMRYDGQGYELPVEVPALGEGGFTPELYRSLRDRFDEDHEREFGWMQREWPVELVFARVAATGVVPDKPTVSYPQADQASEPKRRECHFLDFEESLDTPIIDRGSLRAGDRLDGPAIITQMDTTTIVPPDFTVTVNDTSDLLLERSGDR